MYDTTREAKLCNSSTYNCKLPKVPMQALIEAVNAHFDSVFTSQFTEAQLAKLLWLLTGVRPDTLASTRAKHYMDVARELVRAAARWKSQMSSAKYEDTLAALLRHVDAALAVDKVAAHVGFQEA